MDSLFAVHFPSSYAPNAVHTRTYRFGYTPNTGALAEHVITATKLCALESIATTTTNLVMLYEQVKVHSIKLWGTPPQNGTSLSVGINFNSLTAGNQGNNRQVSDTSMGMTKPAFCMIRPGPNDAAGLWQPGINSGLGALALFSTTIDPNGQANVTFLIDIHVSFRATPDPRVAGQNHTVVGPAVAGGYYYMALDNNSGATGSVGNNWTPFPRSLPTIV